MLIKKKLYCKLNERLLIEDVSKDLLRLLGYSDKSELLFKHIVSIIPEYFFYLENNQFKANKHYLHLKTNKENLILVKANGKYKNGNILLKFLRIKDPYFEDFIHNKIIINEHVNSILNIGILCFNPNGFIISANSIVCQYYGMTSENLIGSKIDLLFQQNQNILKIIYEFISNNQDKLSVSPIIIKKNDEYALTLRWEISKRITQFGFYYLVLLYNDTEKAEVEKKLEYQHKLFQKVFELSPMPIVIFNKNYCIEEVNEALLSFAEVDRTIAIGLDLNKLLDKNPMYVFRDVLERKMVSHYEGYYHTTFSRKRKYVKFVATPIYVDNETKGLGIILDLTNQKQIEEELFQKQEFYKAIVNSAIAGIGITDLNENFVFVNNAFANMLGYEVSEMLDTNLKAYCLPQQYEFFIKQTEIRKLNKNTIYEATLINKNGKPTNILIHATPYKDKDDNIIGTLAVVVDISYQKILSNLYQNLLEENKVFRNKRAQLLESFIKRLNFFLPALFELYKLDKTNISSEKLAEIENNIQRNVLLLSITYEDIELLFEIFSGKYKVRNNQFNLADIERNVQEYFQKQNYLQQYCSIKWLSSLSNQLIELDVTTVIHCIKRIINNLVFRNQAKEITIKFTTTNNNLNILFQMYNTLSTDPASILNFNETHFCYTLVTELLYLIKGKISIQEKLVHVEIPFKKISANKKQQVIISTNFDNVYSTHIWSDKTILYVSEDEMMIQLIQKILANTKINMVILPSDAVFINYVLKHPFADIVLIDDNLVDESSIDYVSVIKRFIPQAYIILLHKNVYEEKNYTKFDDTVLISDKFAEELFKILSKYL